MFIWTEERERERLGRGGIKKEEAKVIKIAGETEKKEVPLADFCKEDLITGD